MRGIGTLLRFAKGEISLGISHAMRRITIVELPGIISCAVDHASNH